MYLKVGSYQFDSNSVTLATRAEAVFNDADQVLSERRMVDVQGYLTASGAAALTTAENQLRAALAVRNPQIAFYQDSGAVTGITLLRAGSISGVKITNVAFPRTQGPEYATERFFTFTAEAEYPASGSTGLLVSFTETVSVEGGGPSFIHLPTINGPPQRQLLYAQTPYRATQQGQAVGYQGYPPPASPLWPGALMRAPRITRTGPKRRGNGYERYTVSWEMEYESVGPLVGLPTLWR